MSEIREQQRLTKDERDRRVLELCEQVSEIEQRLIPTGLHVFGRASDAAERADLLRMVASFDRPETGARALPQLIEEGLNVNASAPPDAGAKVSEKSLRAREQVEALTREAIRRFLAEGSEAACAWLEMTVRVPLTESRRVFALLEKIEEQLRDNRELDAFARALRGEYIEPGPGADIVQNPSILPTGRNTHAVNPYGVPSDLAFARAERLVKLLLERHRTEHGRYPAAMALVLWGLDNIKTQGEGVAQALWLLGVRPVRDGMNRVTDVEAIPLEQLGRPRIDVVMTVSGIFRDLFGATMNLLDRAVQCVAALDEPPESNYVRRNIRARMETEACPFAEAALRVFSNAAGNYGTNVNFMVMDSQWEADDTLADLFVTRKCFAYGRDAEGRALEGREARAALNGALARVEATYQNIDSFEIGITDVDHYFEYLGGVSKAVEKQTDSRPAIYLSDALSRDAKVRSVEETIRLETRTKTLNPKWYEGMLKHGFRGVAEIESHVANTFGWSATADAVDDWVYTEVAETFVLDEQMLERLRELNPHSARSLVARLLEAEGRGFWQAEADMIERLRDIFTGLEDRIEGVA
ncbi:MAG TPA: cobaltochelatase subunit CobN [Pyrinomonadaceae bacterium]|jgi:magnesium chelatase subunit H|nr:cobaltochelatase subunit CobN [Pyrinomonadaceae bacterium]